MPVDYVNRRHSDVRVMRAIKRCLGAVLLMSLLVTAMVLVTA